VTTGRPKVRQGYGFDAVALATAIAIGFQGTAARAAEAEKEAVRNRIFTPDGRFEVGVTWGITMLSMMTQHMNFNLDVGYNFNDSLAVVIAGGYGLGSHTSVAHEVFNEVGQKNPTPPPMGPGALAVAADFQNLWELGPHAELNLRWSPIYGKMNLAGELPVHFQTFLTLGGGVGQFQFYSPVFCLAYGVLPDPNDPANTNPYTEEMNPAVLNSASFQAQNPDWNPTMPATNPGNVAGCVDPLHMTDVKPIVNFGGGFRFFLTKNIALKIEVRDYLFPDFYFVSIKRSQIGGWLNNNPPADTTVPQNATPNAVQAYCTSSGNCNKSGSPGFTSIALFNLGLQWIF